MKRLRMLTAVAVLALAIPVLAGCAVDRTNVRYAPPSGPNPGKLSVSVRGAVIPAADLRDKTKIYPKQIILYTGYYDDKTYDINDKGVDALFDEALKSELNRLGVGIVDIEGIDGPLDKESRDRIRARISSEYPDAQVAVGITVKEFFAETKRNFFSTDAKVKTGIELYALDLQTGEILRTEYGTTWEDTLISADREYLVDKLNEALEELMKKVVRDNMQLRDMLVKVGSRR